MNNGLKSILKEQSYNLILIPFCFFSDSLECITIELDFWENSVLQQRTFIEMLMILKKLFQPIVICARRRLEAKSWREEIPVEWIVSIKGLRFRSFPGRVLACVCSSTSHSVKTIYGANIFKCQSYFSKGEYYYKQVYCGKKGSIKRNKKIVGSTGIWTRDLLHPKQESYP